MIRPLRRFFRRATHAPHQWHPGDIAQCRALHWYDDGLMPMGGPAHGDSYLVAAVAVAPHLDTGKFAQFLIFSAFPEAKFDAAHFVPVTPRAEKLEAATDAFVAQLALAPVEEPGR